MSDTGLIRPGDEASPETPGAGENLCLTCSGMGKLDGDSCTECKRTGKVKTEIGGC